MRGHAGLLTCTLTVSVALSGMPGARCATEQLTVLAAEALVPVAALYASGGMLPYTTLTFTPAFSHTLPPCVCVQVD